MDISYFDFQHFSLCGLCEEETLLNSNLESGYYAGPVWKLTQFTGEFDALMGGRAGWIINRTFAVGVSGYGMMSGMHMHGHDFFDDHDHGNTLSYGGLEFEYIRNSDKLLHYSFAAFFGVGSLGIDEYQNDENDILEHDHHSDTVLIFEPSLNGIVNITPWFRLGAGISWLFVNGAADIGVDSNDAGGPAATLTFKLGRF